MPIQIKSDKELSKINIRGLGFVYNDYSGKTRLKINYNVLHAAHCDNLTRSKTNIRKYYFYKKSEALDWLIKERGEEGVYWRRCGNCDALGQDDVERINSDILETGK